MPKIRVVIGQRGFAKSLTRVRRGTVVRIQPLLVETDDGEVVSCNGFWDSHVFLPEDAPGASRFV